jgi:hypothetical protein
LSSILDALKKAERISAAGDRKPTPWPAPPAAPSDDRRNRQRWLLGSAAAVLAGILVALFWTIRHPAATPPAAPVETATSAVAQKAQPEPAGAQKARTSPTRSKMAAKPSRNASRPVRIARRTPPAAAPQTARIPTTSSVAHPQAQRHPAMARTKPSTVPVQAADRREDQSAYPMRNDPRIKLQALVWSSEAANRFVIINNRLIKEGGSVDNIVVVRINRDDVLLSEGADRWLEPFKVH